MKKFLLFLIIPFCLFSQEGGYSSSNKIIISDEDGMTVNIEGDALAVIHQDQTTDPVVVKFNRIDASTTLKYGVSRGDTIVIVEDESGADIGDYLIIFNPDSLRYSTFTITSITQDTLLGVDNLIDVAYPTGSFVDLATTNMAVDGSTTPQVFGVRGVSPSPIGITVDITRIIFSCQTNNAVDLSKFMDIVGGLDRGLQLRKRDGRFFNVINIKTNRDLSGIMYDWTPFAATNPVQGQDGFVARFTFSRIGVVVRLDPGEDLEWIVSEALDDPGRILEIYAEGHIVQN